MILYTSTQSYLSHLPVVGLSMDSCRAGAGSAERLVAWPTVAGKEDAGTHHHALSNDNQ